MKQETTPEQTVKLIRLGFKKPNNTRYVQHVKARDLRSPFVEFVAPEFEGNYFIGELIEMLLHKLHCRVSIYNVGIGQHKVLFKKLINGKFKVLFREVGYEPIDLLFNCIIKLKEKGVI